MSEDIGATEECPLGATRISIGTDLNQDGILDADEITSAIVVCNRVDEGRGCSTAPGHRGLPLAALFVGGLLLALRRRDA